MSGACIGSRAPWAAGALIAMLMVEDFLFLSDDRHGLMHVYLMRISWHIWPGIGKNKGGRGGESEWGWRVDRIYNKCW